MEISRRDFSAALVAGAAAALTSTRGFGDGYSSQGAQRRLRARTLRRRIILVRSDCAIAGGWAQCHVCAKSADDAAGCGGLGRAMLARQDGPTVLVRAFLFRNDRD